MPTNEDQNNQGRKRVLFLVNGDAESAALRRAWSFAQRLADKYDTEIVTRQKDKIKSVFHFIAWGMAFKPHAVYAVDTGASNVIAAVFIKMVTKNPFILDTGDAIYELAKGSGRRGPIGLLLTRILEKTALSNAQAIVVRGRYHKHYLEGQGFKNVYHVPDGLNLSSDYFCDASSLRKSMGLEDVLTFGIVGSLSWSEKKQYCYGTEVLKAMTYLKDLSIKAVIIGDGDGRKKLEGFAQKNHLHDRVIFVGRVPYAELPKYTRVIDICVSSQSNDYAGWVRTTGKIPEYLACGRYVVANAVGGVCDVISDNGVLIDSDMTNPQYPYKIACAVREVYHNRHLLSSAQSTGPGTAKTSFSYDVLASSVRKVVDDIVGRASCN